MTTRRRKSRKRQAQIDPEAVLMGRIELRPEELFDLIHRVNPTGTELPTAEKTRRYAQKTRLQSLLIRHFGDQHLEVRASEHEDVISLEHRSGSRDACHVLLDELDPKARAWIRLQLDLAATDLANTDLASPVATGKPKEREPDAVGPESASHAAETLEADVDELLEGARSALEEYDYETAESLLRLALERSAGERAPGERAPGERAPAQALLELLVDQLGMDRQALDIEPGLTAATADHPAVRGLLALAAARLGKGDRALSLLSGVSGPRVADVQAALALQAINAGDASLAERRLREVEAVEVAHPQLASLRQDLLRLHAADQQEAEEALAGRYRRDGAQISETETREFLARWPGSEIGRRILRELGAESRETARAEHLAHAEQALAEQKLNDAAQHFQAALDVVGESPELAARLAEAKAGARQQQDEALIADLHAGLSAPDGATSEASLRDYLGFPERLRAQVRERVGSASVTRLLAWLEEAKAPRSGAKAEAAVKAVLALGQNLDTLHHGDAQAALDALAPHRGVLRAIGQARQGLAQARSRVAAEHRERALRTLAAIEASLAQDRIEEAVLLLEGLAEHDLPTGEQGRVEELWARVRHAETIEMKEREHACRLAAQDFLGARESARALAEAAGDDARREVWRRRGERLSKRIAKAWGLEIATEPVPLTELASLRPWYLPQEPLIWLDATGTELILAEAWESWLFLHVIDVHRQEVRTSVSLRVPEPLGKEPALCVDGRRVLVCGEGMFLELRQGDRAQDDWEIVSWRSLRELFPHDHFVKRAGLIPGSDCIWLDVATSAIEWEGEREIHIVDLKTWRLRRQRTEEFAWAIPIAAPGEIDVVLTGHGLGAALHEARGAKKIGLLVDQPAVSAAVGPSGEGLVVLGSPIPELLEEDEKTGILIFYIESDIPGAYSITGNLALELDIEGRNPMLTDLELGLTFLLLQTPELRRYLVAIGASQEGGPEERYRIEVPFETILVQDREARHVLAVCRRGLGLEIFRPGPEPPVLAPFPAFLKGADRLLPESGWPFSCDPLDHVDELPEEKELAHLDKAGQAVGLGWWDEALEHLEGIDPGQLDETFLSHFHHLLGLAQLHAGRAQDALATFEKEVPGPEIVCQLHALREMVRPMSDPPRPAEWQIDQPLIRQLLGTIRTAEHALASGSVAQALAALNHPAVWSEDEVQSVARLAAAHLESSARSPGERFHKRRALAFYCGLEERGRQKEIDFPGLKWEPERLRELRRRARAWLEAE